jgi:hypothetical protein
MLQPFFFQRAQDDSHMNFSKFDPNDPLLACGADMNFSKFDPNDPLLACGAEDVDDDHWDRHKYDPSLRRGESSG